MLSPDPNNRPTATKILEMPFIMQRAKKLVSENDEQLKNVNIIKRKGRKKRISSPKKKGRLLTPAPPPEPENTPLPLPDEEPPRWAQRGPASQRSDPLVVEEEDVPEPNEWDDLKDFTEQLRDSISTSNQNYITDTDEDNIDPIAARKEINSIMESLKDFPQKLLSLLEFHIRDEDNPSSNEFVEIMESSDAEVVEKMRRVVYLKKMLHDYQD